MQGAIPESFTGPGPRDEINLLGQRCRDCGARAFPQRMSCVRCYGHNLDPIPLDRTGRVVTCAVVRQAPSGYHGPLPYVIGNVALDDGVVVISQLVGKPIDEWRAGDAVAACAVRLPVAQGDSTLTVYGFRPAEQAEHCKEIA